MRVFVILAVLAGSFIGLSAPAANAGPMCEVVSTGGSYFPVWTQGECIPYSGATLCTVEGAGFDPDAHVYTLVCTPAIDTGSNPPSSGP